MTGVLGLDFGTTNTLCAWMDNDKPIIIPNDRGERTTPSVYAISQSGQELVGTSALNQAFAMPDSIVFGIKRLLGKKSTIKINNKEFKTEEIAGKIIKKAIKDSEKYLGFDIRNAVITVPARFSDPQRRAVREAASLAGVKTVRIMNEPSAAALARSYIQNVDNEKHIVLVYDFGGGTFDATVLKSSGGTCSVLSSEGDDELGGMDIDIILRENLGEKIKEEYNLDIKKDPYLWYMLLDLCEKAKIELSLREEVTISIPFLRGINGIVNPVISLDRSSFNKIVEPFITKSIKLVKKVISQAGIGPKDIDVLVMSGGSSRIPMAKEMLEDLTSLKPNPQINPEEIVALGASVEAARMEGRLTGLVFNDVVSRTFGLEIDSDGFIPIIKKNDPLPAKKKRIFTTVEDFQHSVEVHVLQGEDKRASLNQSVGRFLLTGLRHQKKGEPRIEVDFSIDESDMLYVTAKDLDTGSEQSITIFDGDTHEESPNEKILILSHLIKREAMEKSLDASMKIEMDELLEATQKEMSNDEKKNLIYLLESFLAEINARNGIMCGE